VGGSTPVHDEIIINTSRMNKILGFDETYGIVSSEAGTILKTLQDYTIERGYEMPIDLGAKGSCQIGGNLATNAGGLKLIRHNSLHANTIGLKAVLADGTILDNMTTLRKDNTGYDLKHLFIGSEGTLGIITECSILCPPYPNNKNVSLVAVRTFDDVLKLLHLAKKTLSDIIQAFEVMDREAVDLVLKTDKNAVFPF
jgi:D-2-hydroxyglutarate dehydrogenase